jgi:hypothetical protein
MKISSYSERENENLLEYYQKQSACANPKRSCHFPISWDGFAAEET